MVRIKDIAEQAGVSPTTVSNVIHGKTKRVSQETVKKIQQLMEEYHYKPNISMKTSSLSNSNLIGVIIAFEQKGEKKIVEDPFFSAMIAQLEVEIKKRGYYMMLYAAEEAFDIFMLASTWNTAGLIIFGFTGMDCVNLKKQTEIPFITIDCYMEEKYKKSFVNIGLDDFNGGYQIGKFLVSYGHKKIAFLADNDIGVNHARWKGFQKALEEENIVCGKEQYVMIELEEGKRRLQYKSLLAWFKSHTALCCTSDYYAVELINFLKDHEVAVPQQISVTGFDDSMLAQIVRPRLTTVQQDISRRAIIAIEDLMKLIEGERIEEKSKKIPTKVVVRDSVKNWNET